MEMNGTMLNKEDCENAKEVVSKYGVTLVCDEEETKEVGMLFCQQVSSAKI